MSDQDGTPIDITGLDKAHVLKALYDQAKPLGLGALHYTPEPMTIEEARSLVATASYFDYIHGRVMKVVIAGDALDPWAYDRDNGAGRCEAIIADLRSATEKEAVTT